MIDITLTHILLNCDLFRLALYIISFFKLSERLLTYNATKSNLFPGDTLCTGNVVLMFLR